LILSDLLVAEATRSFSNSLGPNGSANPGECSASYTNLDRR